MNGSEKNPVLPDDIAHDNNMESPWSPDSGDDSSEAGTPLEAPCGSKDFPAASSSLSPPKRVPSLKTVSENRNMSPSSTALGFLGQARNPVRTSSSFAGGAGAVNNDIVAKMRGFSQQRLQKGISPGTNSPVTSQSPSVGGPNGFPGSLQSAAAMQRPGPVSHPKSAPVVPKSSLSERRANKMGMGMKLSDMGGSSPAPGLRRAGAPKLSDITGEGQGEQPTGQGRGSKMDDFKKYIDTEKGWITFDGAATITRTGVNFSNGNTFSISLDEVEILEELGKGNYGTVYMVKHAKPKVPRFGHGLSGVRPKNLHHSQSDSGVMTRGHEDGDVHGDGTTGIVMAMKEIRLELDDAKFTTILKELVILHECASPYIIDFYGAFFQEGAVYMCIEHMDGGSIDKLYSGGIPENILRKITYSTVMGLKSLKDDHNIIHRDVKPTNILANTRGHIKICDFGVSGNLVASIAKTNIGCQSYMAPERISGGGMSQAGSAEGTYNVQSDIWSLGLTIIECAMGQYPYPPEIASTIFGQLNAIVEGEPPGLPEEGYSDTAKDFVAKCLHKVAKMRPTYALLVKHPWLKPLSNPYTITEEAEEGEEAEQIAEAVGKLNVGNSSTDDAEVAEWVKSVLTSKLGKSENGGTSRPALHAAPLDTTSPTSSPLLNK